MTAARLHICRAPCHPNAGGSFEGQPEGRGEAGAPADVGAGWPHRGLMVP